MSLTPNNVSYHDLTSLQQLRGNAAKDEPAALRQAAEQFEAIFVSMLLSSMRKANEGFEVEGMMNSQTTKFFRDMHDSQLATELAQNGSLGLADMLVQQLGPAAGIKADKASAQPHTLDMTVRQQAAPTVQPSALSGTDAPANSSQVASPQAIAARLMQQVLSEQKPTAVEQMEPKAEWKVQSPLEFVRQLLPAARKTAQTLGLDPMALIAQAALETGWGQRMIKTAQGDNSFNLFGIKANHGWKGDTAVVDTLEYRQGVAKKEQAKFRAYASPEHSLQDYVNFISKSARYQDAVSSASDPQAYFEQLQAAGYATDPSYAKKIMAVYQNPAFEQARQELNTANDNAQDVAQAAD